LRIFALEYATGGGILESPALASCRPEGEAMLRRLVGDLADIPGVEIEIAVDEATSGWPQNARCHHVTSADRVHPTWDEIMSASDAIWPIAPETGGILADLTARAEQRQLRVLGSPSGVVRLAGSKRATSEHLATHGLPVVPTYSFQAAPDLPPSTTGWVVKPDDGAGSEGTLHLATTQELRRWCSDCRDEAAVIQPFVPGIPISISMLAQRGRAWILACNTQDVRREGNEFSYYGGWVGGAEELRPLLTPIAEAVAEAMPQLWGYAGIDLIATPAGPVILEINPRLTTSYVGLRASIGLNPAEIVLRLLDEPLPSLIRPIAPRVVRVEARAP
jgi:predicted ATP-grasp superfamily ATP-dependent carboligase